MRPDPLTPLAEVERIVGFASELSPLIAIVAVIKLGGATLASAVIVVRTEPSGVQSAALALNAYLVVSALTPLFGAFPVPLVGMTMSPILGF